MCAKRLRTATAGFPEGRLGRTLFMYSAVFEAIEDRYFEAMGCLPGAGSEQVKQVADQLFASLRRAR